MATGNSMIRVQMEGMRSVQREVSELFSRRANRTEADWKATVERHRTLYEAIAAGDGDARRAEHQSSTMPPPTSPRSRSPAGSRGRRRGGHERRRFSLGGRRALVTGAELRHRPRARARASPSRARSWCCTISAMRQAPPRPCARSARRGAGAGGRLHRRKAPPRALAGRSAGRHGPIDILVANAAIERRAPWTEVVRRSMSALHVASEFHRRC